MNLVGLRQSTFWLLHIITITLCAIISGADNWVAIAIYG